MEKLSVLVYSKTDGYRHEATEEAKESMKELAISNNWNIELTEDSTYFTVENLEKYDVIVFLLTIGEVLDEKGKKAFQEYIDSGNGFVAVHSGPITLMEWPWFMKLIGAGFIGHPPVQEAKVIIEDPDHPSVDFIADKIIFLSDEWYSFNHTPRSSVNVIMSIDESSYDVDDNRWFDGVDQRMGDHPIVWSREYNGSRIFQSGFGHEAAYYQSEFMKKHLTGGIEWAGRLY